MSWPGEKQRHGLSRRRVKTKKEFTDKRLKQPVKVTWLQKDKKGNVMQVSEEFKNKEGANNHIKKLKQSAKKLDMPVKIVSVKGGVNDGKKQR